jgi:hypothetical protein
MGQDQPQAPAGRRTNLTAIPHSIGWWPGLFWKSEYRFADYRSQTARINFISTALYGITGPTGMTERIHRYVQTVRSELVWRFNWASGPVRAAKGDRPLVHRSTPVDESRPPVLPSLGAFAAPGMSSMHPRLRPALPFPSPGRAIAHRYFCRCA